MNAEEFDILTGSHPVQDDLERVNCHLYGKYGHFNCGVCPRCGQPRFMCPEKHEPVMKDLSSDMDALDAFEIAQALIDGSLCKALDTTLRIEQALTKRGLDMDKHAIY